MTEKEKMLKQMLYDANYDEELIRGEETGDGSPSPLSSVLGDKETENRPLSPPGRER